MSDANNVMRLILPAIPYRPPTPRVTAAIRRTRRLEEDRRPLQDAVVAGLAELVRLRDGHGGGHRRHLAAWGGRVAAELGLGHDDQRSVEVASLLHDLGKIGVPDAILRKPGPLTPEERRVVNLHAEYGSSVLRRFADLRQAGLFILHHHERMDGSGYPGGLRGTEIPLGARIVAVVDAFDAMVSDRSYRGGVGPEQAAARLLTDAGTQFDPDVVRQFVPLVLKA